MKGVKIIPMFLFLIALSYLGALFVEANSTMVEIRFLTYQSPPLKAGLVALLAAFVGTIVSGLLCSIEILALYVQNRQLKRKLRQYQKAAETAKAADVLAPGQELLTPRN